MESYTLLLVAVIGTFVALLLLWPIAKKIGLVDTPTARKTHDSRVPLVGGISIYLVLSILALSFLPWSQTLILFLLSATLIVFIGVIDDYFNLSAKPRLLAQMLIALIMVYGTDYGISSLGNLLGFGMLDLGIFTLPFTMMALAGTINAFNMVDGIDGLAGSLALIAFAAIFFMFSISGQTIGVELLIILSGCIATYLLFNVGPLSSKRKVFMGDSGSMLLGLCAVWLLSFGTQGEVQAFRPVTALWLIAVPLIDMFAIMHRRIRKGHSPMKADRDHLHHTFMRMGYSQKQALLMISATAIFYAAVGIVGEAMGVPAAVMFALFLLLLVGYDYAFIHVWKVIRFVKRH